MNRRRALQFGIGHLLMAMVLAAALTLTFSKSIFETRILCLALGLFCILCNGCALFLHFLLKQSKRASVMWTFFASLAAMVMAWILLGWLSPAWNGWLTPDRILGVLVLVPIAACGAVTSAIVLMGLSRESTEPTEA
jgi:peptidoglycan biosynthesis protein MviN/MurJ (putative lipid II flippase)